MAIDEGLFALVQESLEPLGVVTMRKMMGGATLYLDGTIFAVIADDELWLKADKTSDATWDEAGAARFTTTMGEGRTGTMNYRRAPAEVYDDPHEMRRWATVALDAGVRSAAAKNPKAQR